VAPVGALTVTVWSDYCCPWCYLGRDRSSFLVELGAEITPRPFELHPETPKDGWRVRAGGRLSSVYTAIGMECAELGLPFNPPTRVPNSRRALETAAVVAEQHPVAFDALDDELFAAHFVHDLDLSDGSVLDDIVERSGAPVDDVARAVTSGLGKALVDASMADAREHGVAGTHAWLFEPDFVLPGVQPRAVYERIVTRLRVRSHETTTGPER